jgi:hypothetical protein
VRALGGNPPACSGSRRILSSEPRDHDWMGSHQPARVRSGMPRVDRSGRGRVVSTKVRPLPALQGQQAKESSGLNAGSRPRASWSLPAYEDNRRSIMSTEEPPRASTPRSPRHLLSPAEATNLVTQSKVGTALSTLYVYLGGPASDPDAPPVPAGPDVNRGPWNCSAGTSTASRKPTPPPWKKRCAPTPLSNWSAPTPGSPAARPACATSGT